MKVTINIKTGDIINVNSRDYEVLVFGDGYMLVRKENDENDMGSRPKHS